MPKGLTAGPSKVFRVVRVSVWLRLDRRVHKRDASRLPRESDRAIRDLPNPLSRYARGISGSAVNHSAYRVQRTMPPETTFSRRAVRVLTHGSLFADRTLAPPGNFPGAGNLPAAGSPSRTGASFFVAEAGLEPATFGLWARRATTAPPRNEVNSVLPVEVSDYTTSL